MDLLLIFTFISACLLFILAASFLLYQVPLRVTVSFRQEGSMQKTALMAVWGMLGMRRTNTGNDRLTEICVGKLVVLSRAAPVHEEENQTEPGIAGIRSAPDLVPFVRDITGPVRELVHALYHEISFRDARGTVRIGFSDPVATGMLYGGYWATRFVLEASRIRLDMVPVFDRECLELDLAARFTVSHPFRILGIGARMRAISGLSGIHPVS